MPTYNGNNGNNTINGSNGDDIINGNGGNDNLDGLGGHDTINGGTGNDDIEGGTGNDIIHGNDHDDEIFGESGNDTLFGDSGNDEIFGGDNDDDIDGGSGNDELDGGNHNDTIAGGTGNDDIVGGSGNDILHGNDNDDDVSGGIGNDTLTGDAGNDELDGGDNDDNLDGGSGNDVLAGGNHNDSASGGTGDDQIDGGSGNDILHGNDNDDVVEGGTGNDTITGDDGDDQLSGGDNDDNLNGGAGNDVLDGGNHNDTLTGGGGYDLIYGGAGTDTAVYSGSVTEYDFFTFGPLVTVSHDGGAGADGIDLLLSVERLQFSDVTIDLTQNNAPIAFNDIAATNEDAGVYSSGAASVLDNDFDFEGDALTVTAFVMAGTYGTLTMNADGTYSYALNANAQTLAQGQTGQDTFTYTVSDGSLSDTATLTINVTGNNDAPVANPDAASTSENASVLVNVLVNDSDVDNGAVLTVTSASAPLGQGTASVVGNQVQFNPGSAFDHLNVGDSQVVVVSYSIQDQFGATSSSTVSITVTGTNDGPVANPDVASAGENQTILVNVLVNDSDVDDGAVLTVTSATAPPGQGTASVVGNQVQWNPGTDFDHLAVSATSVVVVNYSIQDEHGAASSSTLTINVTGTNDGPVANPDVASAGENQTILVNVLVNDSDADDGAVLTVTAASAPPGQGTASVVGNQVQWNPGTDFDHLALGATQLVVVSYSIQDQFGASSSSTVSITVTGTNDGPVANADVASTSENASVSINVLTNDTDVDDGAVLTVTAASAPPGQGTATVVANQVQFNPGADFDYLAVGESTVVVLNYSIQDEHGATSSSTVAVTVTGTNDAPTIDAGGTDASGSITELPNNHPNENAFSHTDSGTIAFDDVDLSDTHSASFTPQGGGYVGTFSLDPVNQAGDTVGWDFSVDDSAIDFLDAGDTLTQTYAVEIDDGNGGTVTQNVTITITGAADASPPDGTNWYIDNSAVGSTQDGSADNPYLSIAAFNAAQGTPGGPGVNDNVFLLAGTGTYAEADGINLADGQTLTGVAAGPLRPTIVTTGGTNHGIELAQNNNVTGVDIGNTTGAGISDGGGTVGNLTISDVAKSGSGQIADIDQGGTLNVTLNAAASTGSTGGAIDLAGIGGSFTVSGATSISGSHAGGGVDVTGSSAAVSLAGGGTIDTGTATAVNYVGNGGSLHLGGGIDLVTTSGAGLNATGGGTVTVTGAGNSIASTTGTALNISNTAIGLADVTFELISSNGSVSGIILNNTGTSASFGGLVVTGSDGADLGTLADGGSGGTIQNTSGDAISLTSTRDVSLGGMNIEQAGNNDAGADNANWIEANDVTNLSLLNVNANDSVGHGVNGSNVSNLVIDAGSFLGGGADNDSANWNGINITNLLGASSITDSLFERSNTVQARINNNANGGGQDTLTVSGTTWQNHTGPFAGDHLSVSADSGSNLGLVVDGSAGNNIFLTGGIAIQATGAGSGLLDVDISGVVAGGALLGGATLAGIVVAGVGTSSVTFEVHDNVTLGTGSVAMSFNDFTSGTFSGTIEDNNITHVAGSGTDALQILSQGNQPGSDGAATIAVLDNVIVGDFQRGIRAQSAFGDGTLNLNITGNIVHGTGPSGLRGMEVEVGGSGPAQTNRIFLNLENNDSWMDSGAAGYRLFHRAGYIYSLEDLTGSGTTAANITNWIDVVKNNNSNGGPATTLISGAANNFASHPSTPAPMLATEAGDGADRITQAELGGLIDAAILMWADAGASKVQLDAMRATSVSIADLDGLHLGQSAASGIVIDGDAAGHGWFVDLTPEESSEFAASGGPAAGKMDLLTVLLHELGHQIGLEDGYSAADAHELMHGYLETGERRLPDGLSEANVALTEMLWNDMVLPALPHTGEMLL